MASAASALRGELKDFLVDNATKDFLEAFEFIDKQYNIKEHKLVDEDGKVEVAELIDAGRFLHNTNFRTSKFLFATFNDDDGSIAWYY